MANIFHIKSQGRKLVPIEKEYLPSDQTYDTNIWMTDVQGGDLSSRNCFWQITIFGISYYMLKNVLYSIPSFIGPIPAKKAQDFF